jgi:hypothetical protein
MTPRSRKVAVFVGTAALAAGAGIGVAASGSSSAATEPRTAPGMDSLRQSGPPDDPAAALAEELGVSEDKVRDALENAMPQGGPPDGQTGPAPVI